jgi:hypothetical protein
MRSREIPFPLKISNVLAGNEFPDYIAQRKFVILRSKLYIQYVVGKFISRQHIANF